MTKILRAGDKTLTAPRSESGRPVEADALRLWLRKDKSKVFNKTTNAVWAEVYGFYFFARSGLSAVEVEEECRRATDGEVLYLEAGARAKAASLTGDAKEKALMLRALPLELIELKQSSLRIPEKDWKAHVRSLQDAHEKTKPSAVVCIDTSTADATAAGSSFVGGDIERDVPIEYACEGFIDEGKKLWLAVQVHNGSNKVISKTELEKGGYVVKLTATHTEGTVKNIEASHFYAGGAAWLQPKLDEPGEWVCSIAVVNSVGNLGGFAGPFVLGWLHDAAPRGACGACLAQWGGGIVSVGGFLLAATACSRSVLLCRPDWTGGAGYAKPSKSCEMVAPSDSPTEVLGRSHAV